MKIVHASPGFGLKLTQEQTIEFLTEKKTKSFTWYGWQEWWPIHTSCMVFVWKWKVVRRNIKDIKESSKHSA